MPVNGKNPEVSTIDFIRQRLSTGHTPRSIARELDLSTQVIYDYMAAIRAQAAMEELESDSA